MDVSEEYNATSSRSERLTLFVIIYHSTRCNNSVNIQWNIRIFTHTRTHLYIYIYIINNLVYFTD
jgi:hypothetical protein